MKTEDLFSVGATMIVVEVLVRKAYWTNKLR